jgi:Domain of unknown function (DUF4136)
MRRALLGVVLLSAIGFGVFAHGCATVSVATDFDRNVDFAHYQTYAFLGGHIWVNGVADDGNTLVKDRIRTAIVAAMGAKGMRETTENPDMYVTYLAGARKRTEIEATTPFSPGVGPYWGVGGWWGPMYTDWWARTYDEGTLIIDLIDAPAKKLVWRAYAQSEINPPGNGQKISQSVEKAFKKYPPAH